MTLVITLSIVIGVMTLTQRILYGAMNRYAPVVGMVVNTVWICYCVLLGWQQTIGILVLTSLLLGVEFYNFKWGAISRKKKNGRYKSNDRKP